MTQFVNNNVSSGGVVFASDHNEMGTRIAAVVNGGIDTNNISPTAAIAGSQIATGTITDTQLDASVSAVTRGSETFFDFVASGCVWTADAAGSTRAASMTAGVVYIGGKRVAVSAVTSRTFTASKDVYVDIDNTGTLSYFDNTTNAASPALAANSVRNGILVVGASNIAATTSINQGQENRVLPIASSIPYAVTDSLGNLICPHDPQRKLLGYRQILVQFSTTSATAAQITGLSVPYIPVTGRKVKVSAGAPQLYANNASAHRAKFSAWEGTPNSGTLLQSTIGVSNASGASIQGGGFERVYTPSGTTALTVNGGLNSDSAGVSAVVDIDGSGTCIWLKVELE